VSTYAPERTADPGAFVVDGLAAGGNVLGL
jgi:hypothetical protein